MTWGAVAVGGATLASGYLAAKSSSKASKAASNTSAAELAFAQQQYEDWKEVYGPIQENLSTYYQNVTPEYYAATGLENFQQEYQASISKLQQNLAQRGISESSGIAASLEAQAELGAAEQKAAIRSNATSQAIQDQSNFLSLGLGLNPSSSVSSTLASQSSTAAQQAAIAQQAAGSAWSAAIPALGSAVSSIYNQYGNTSNTSSSNIMAGSPYIDYNTGIA